MTCTIDQITDQDLVEAPPVPTAMVRVTQLARDTFTLNHTAGLTVGVYLAQAGITVEHGEVVTVNGAPARLDTIVEADSVVVVAGKIANG